MHPLKRVRDAPTEEAALEILMVSSSSEARRRKLSNNERARIGAQAMSGAVPDEVHPAYGQGALDLRTGSRGGSEIFNTKQPAAAFELSATNSTMHTPFEDGDASRANSCPWQQCQVPTSSVPTLTNANSSAQHQSAETESESEVVARKFRTPPCAVSTSSCEENGESSAMRSSCAAEPNAYGVRPPAAEQSGVARAPPMRGASEQRSRANTKLRAFQRRAPEQRVGGICNRKQGQQVSHHATCS